MIGLQPYAAKNTHKSPMRNKENVLLDENWTYEIVNHVFKSEWKDLLLFVKLCIISIDILQQKIVFPMY